MTAPRISYVTHGRKTGFEALDREEHSFGLFETAGAAANAALEAAERERGTG